MRLTPAIQADRSAITLRQLPAALGIEFVAWGLLYLYLQPQLELSPADPWVWLALLGFLARGLLLLLGRRQPLPGCAAGCVLVSAWLGGGYWAGSALWLQHLGAGPDALFALLVLLVSALHALALAARPLAAWGQAVLTLLPAAMLLAADADPTHAHLGLALVGALIALLLALRNLSRQIDASLRLAHDYGLLAETLEQARRASEQLNDELRHEIEVREQIESVLAAEREQALTTLSSIADGVIVVDAGQRIRYLNPVASRLLGVATPASGRRLGEVLHLLRDTDDGQVVVDPVALARRRGEALQLAGLSLIGGPGEVASRAVQVSVSPLGRQAGDAAGMVLVLHDVTELQALTRDLSHQASHDPLTGLVNRREFERRVAAELGRGAERTSVLLFLDLDQFKVVNDTCGHAAGDELLCQLGQRLQEVIRDSDTLARLGGDEFGVLLLACPRERGRELAEQLRRLVEDYRLLWQGRTLQVGVSVGMVLLDGAHQGLAEVLSAADAACYLAKEQGRNAVYEYQGMSHELLHHQGQMQWVPRIQRALAENRFCLHAQAAERLGPADDGIRRYVEILLRMRGTDDNLIGPAAFLPAAERYNLIRSLDCWVVSSALTLLAGHPGALSGDRLFAINISAQSLGSADFLDFVVGQFQATGLDARRICLEVTETTAINHLAGAERFMRELKALGCRFALDDFGSGLSSLSYLKRLPIDFLKIDGHFVQDLCVDDTDAAMVEAINQMAHRLGLHTVAEFAESAEVLARLRAMGVDYAQGYHLAVPRPLVDYLND